MGEIMKIHWKIKVVLLTLTIMFLSSCDKPRTLQTTGYVRANLVYLSAPYGGYLDHLAVKEGDAVKMKDVIFELNPQPEEDHYDAAKAQWRAAKANLAEIKRLKPKTSKNQVDNAKEGVSAQLAQVRAAEWAYKAKTVHAPVKGIVSDVYYQEGEFVLPMRPVISLFVPSEMTIVFYVPEVDLSQIKPHQHIQITVGKSHYKTEISTIDKQAQYTPDIMFSEQVKHKLVYKITAKMTKELQSLLNAGQPVDVNYEP